MSALQSILEKKGKTKEGVVKIASFQRAYGGGYLTLTFIVDIEGRMKSF